MSNNTFIKLPCRVTQQPKLFSTKNGGVLVTIPVAFNSYNMNTKLQSTLFIDVISVNPEHQGLQKGTLLEISGSFYVDTYKNQARLKVNAHQLILMPPKQKPPQTEQPCYEFISNPFNIPM